MATKISELGDTQDVEWLNATATGTVKAPNGTAALPSYSFASDPNTGFYRVGADQIGFAVAGFRTVYIDSSSFYVDGVNLSVGGNAAFGDRNLVTASTGDATLNATSNIGTTRTNTGAAGEVILTLPSATTGHNYRFVVTAAQYLRIKAAGSDTIRNAGTVSAAAGYIRANAIGNAIRIECAKSGEWYVTSVVGTWTIDS